MSTALAAGSAATGATFRSFERITVYLGPVPPWTDAPDRRDYLALHLLDGRMIVRGDTGEVRLKPGHLLLAPPAALELDADPGARVLVMRIPAEELGSAGRWATESGARVWTAEAGTASLLAHLLRGLAEQLDRYSPRSPGRIAGHIVGLLAMMCSDVLDAEEPPVRVQQRELVHRAKEYVDRRIADYDLTPASVARAHNVSPRTLARAFEAEATSVAAWIRHRRLERCRDALSDPALAHATVASIGAAHGIWDGAQLSRMFKAEFGVTPREYRARHAGAAAAQRRPSSLR